MPKSDPPFHPAPPPSAGSGDLPPSRMSTLLRASLPRLVGFGMLALLSFDLARIAVDYHLGDPTADARLGAQLIDQAGAMLVAYVLVFLDSRSTTSRASRAAMKLLSWAALLGAVVFVGLAGLTVSACVRIYRANVWAANYQLDARTNALRLLETKLPALTAQQTLLVLAEQVPALRPQLAALSPAQLTAELRRQITLLRADAEGQQRRSLAQAKRDQTIFAAKYFFSGLIVAAVLLLIFENTRPARQARVFLHEGDAPNLKFEDSVARGFGRAFQSMESLGDLILPDFNSWRWYRRLKRWLKREK